MLQRVSAEWESGGGLRKNGGEELFIDVADDGTGRRVHLEEVGWKGLTLSEGSISESNVVFMRSGVETRHTRLKRTSDSPSPGRLFCPRNKPFYVVRSPEPRD